MWCNQTTHFWNGRSTSWRTWTHMQLFDVHVHVPTVHATSWRTCMQLPDIPACRAAFSYENRSQLWFLLGPTVLWWTVFAEQWNGIAITTPYDPASAHVVTYQTCQSWGAAQPGHVRQGSNWRGLTNPAASELLWKNWSPLLLHQWRVGNHGSPSSVQVQQSGDCSSLLIEFQLWVPHTCNRVLPRK